MTYLNSLLRGLFDFLLLPFRSLPWWAGLVVVSFVLSLGMLLVFRATSNQEEIRAVRRRIHACLFEIRLFRNDLRAVFGAQGEMLRLNLAYLRLCLVPALWMLVPFVLITAQLQSRYGYSGLEPGDRALLKVVLKRDPKNLPAAGRESQPEKPPISLEAPAGLTVETPSVWIPSQREVTCRIRADQWGDHELKIEYGNHILTKTVTVSRQAVRRSPTRIDARFLDQVLYPAEDPLPENSGVESISVTYPERVVAAAVPTWLALLFVLVTAFAFALRKPLRVSI